MGLWDILKTPHFSQFLQCKRDAMGLWDVLRNINNAEGIREVVRRSYDENFNLVVKSGVAQTASKVGGHPLSETKRHFALFGVLEDYYLASGVKNAEKLIWAELLPFLYLDKQTAQRALTEYVVYKEMPVDAEISWLETVVQRGCQVAKSKKDKEAYSAWMPVAKTNGMVWLLLFEGRGNDYFW